MVVYMDGMDKEEEVFGYEDQCIITVGEWTQDPWGAEDHAYYQVFNDMDLTCFYIPEDDYETCYAYFRGYEDGELYYEFADGTAWMWPDCGYLEENYEAAMWNCYGGEWSVGPSDFSYSEMSEWVEAYYGWDSYYWDSYYSWGSMYYSWDDYYWGDYYSWGSYYSWGYYYWDDMYYYDTYYGGRGDRRDKGALK